MADYLYTISAFFMTFEDFFKDTKKPLDYEGELMWAMLTPIPSKSIMATVSSANEKANKIVSVYRSFI